MKAGSPDDRAILFLAASAEEYGSDRMLLESVMAVREDFKTIVALPSDGPLRTKLSSIGVETILFGDYALRRNYLSARGAVGVAIRNASTLWKLLQIVRRTHVVLVYSNTQAVALGPILARLAGIPHIWHVHELLDEPGWLAHALSGAAAQRPSTVLACSRAVREQLTKSWRSWARQILVVPNGIDVNDCGARPTDGEGNHPLRVGCVARIHPWKGQRLLLSAVAKMLASDARLAEHMEVHFFGGAFRGYEWYEHLLREDTSRLRLQRVVMFHGFEQDRERLFSGLDAVVVASTRPEPFGLACVEAPARGIPVIAPREGGPQEIIRDGHSGLLFEARDDDSLAEALSRLLKEPQLRVRLAAAGRRNAVTHYSSQLYRSRIRQAVVDTVDC